MQKNFRKKPSIIRKRIYGFTFLLLSTLLFAACGSDNEESGQEESGEEAIVRSVEFQYATEVSIDFYQDDYAHIQVSDGNDYILIPNGKEDKDFGFSGATLIHQDLQNIYQASSSVMDLLIQIDELDKVSFCSTTADDYSIQEVKDRIASGDITYVGKYSAPDYEALLSGNCDFALENTMIYHTPKIKEQLEEIGIPVFVERSSYESEPLGRLEWIKVYGVLFGKEAEAEAYFDEQSAKIKAVTESLEEDEKNNSTEEKTVAIFYISSNGYVNVRKPDDYLVKMIETAGGTYALADLMPEEENALSTVNIDLEDFYREAKDADILIYNGTIDNGVKTLHDLLEKNELFSDFKAVSTGQVYCTNLNMFQESSKLAEITEDFYHVIKNDGNETNYLFKLE